MKTLFAKDIQCNHCTMRIKNAFDHADIQAEISLENKTIKIEESNLEKALDILDDLGFPAEII